MKNQSDKINSMTEGPACASAHTEAIAGIEKPAPSGCLYQDGIDDNCKCKDCEEYARERDPWSMRAFVESVFADRLVERRLEERMEKKNNY